MTVALQKHLPYAPWLDPPAWRLPGTQPLDPAEWLVMDDAYAAQMALRDEMIGGLQEDIYRCLPEAEGAANECLDMVLTVCATLPGYEVGERRVRRPDGVKVIVHREMPLLTIGRLIQDDVCILQKRGDEHVLTGAILCFPASWTLAQKIGRPLVRIHKPVPKYDGGIGRRVQRLFDAIRVGRPMWRANAHLEDDPALFAPRDENTPHAPKSAAPPYLRSERQTLMRLPKSGAVVFGIHTWMVAVEDLTDAQRGSLGAIMAQYAA